MKPTSRQFKLGERQRRKHLKDLNEEIKRLKSDLAAANDKLAKYERKSEIAFDNDNIDERVKDMLRYIRSCDIKDRKSGEIYLKSYVSTAERIKKFLKESTDERSKHEISKLLSIDTKCVMGLA